MESIGARAYPQYSKLQLLNNMARWEAYHTGRKNTDNMMNYFLTLRTYTKKVKKKIIAPFVETGDSSGRG